MENSYVGKYVAVCIDDCDNIINNDIDISVNECRGFDEFEDITCDDEADTVFICKIVSVYKRSGFACVEKEKC